MRFTALTVCLLVLVGGMLAARPAHSAEDTAPSAWAIDPVHSAIVWTIGHNNGVGLVYGRFDSFGGTIIADAMHPERSSVEVSVDAASVDTATAARDEHLRTADFFNIAKFPALSFQSTDVSPVTGVEGAYDVTGDLTLLGVTKQVTVRMQHTGVTTDMKGANITGFNGSFNIMRSDYGMGFGIPGVSDEVNIMLAFECREAVPTAAAQ
jgi:polyisoprenoid-binding protein YceI